MRVIQYLIFVVLMALQPLAFAAACPASSDTTSAGNGACTITGSASTITLNFNSGFDSSTAITAIDGNNGTTVGAQRKLSFIKAAEIISAQVTSSVTLVVDASFASLTCTSNSAILGSAGASTNLGVSSGAPSGILLNTFYPIGLYNAITGSDANSSTNDIAASFNANLGNSGCLQSSNGWYYGFATPASNYIGFTTVLLHEITHGLGFASLVNPSTGAKASGIDDIFSNNLYDKANSRNWNDGSESNANRATSVTSVSGLLWSGSNTNAQAIGLLSNGFDDVDADGNFESGDKIEMYAPSSVESGSSISHFSSDATPNELMEPSYTDGQYSLSLALYLLQDIGWGIVTNSAPTITAVDQTSDEDVAKVVDASGWGSDVDGGDTLTYSVTNACATNITCSINTDGTSLTMTPAANHNGATHTITVNVSDGNGGSASDTLNFTVTAVNDAPTITAVNQSSTEDNALSGIDASGWGSDVDGGDTLTYSVTNACATNITCSINTDGTSLTMTPAANHNGATHTITVNVSDGNGGSASDTLNFTVTAVNDAPSWNAIPNQNITVGSNAVINLNTYASDVEGDSLSYSATACGANLTCAISSNTLTVTANGGAATTVTVTIEANDSNGGTRSDSFDVTINSSPTLTAIDQSSNEDSDLVVNISSWGSDADGDALTYAVTACA
ncbi:MAG: Ig-like domain-containing protein, partial [Bermanella sp.]